MPGFPHFSFRLGVEPGVKAGIKARKAAQALNSNWDLEVLGL